MTKTVLVLVETVDDYLPLLEDNGYRLIRAKTPALRAEAIARHGGEIDVVLTRGPLGITAASSSSSLIPSSLHSALLFSFIVVSF